MLGALLSKTWLQFPVSFLRDISFCHKSSQIPVNLLKQLHPVLVKVFLLKMRTSAYYIIRLAIFEPLTRI